MMTKVPEILAPAGGRAQFFAALNSGADAVYLGLKTFNARARANNFTLEELRELKAIADRFDMKILVAVNVLIKQDEIKGLMATLAGLEELDIHAIIVQDLAVAALVKEFFPRIRLHASTQLAVHNLHGVKAAAAQGFKRVVLARELTAQELRHICEHAPADVEVEAFCHGSLCYSYSGLCFFSGADDGRSGNRGECAYTCRQPYRIVSEAGHGFLFSMRDLDTSDQVGLLVNAGIDTLKIEGRKKDAQYVSSVVRLYRQKLDEFCGFKTLRSSAPQREWSDHELTQDLKLSFHRRTTSLFIGGRYHENVIDLDSPSHQGLEAGRVTGVYGRSVRFTTTQALSRYDGLRIDRGAHGFHALPQHGTNVVSSPQALQQKYDNDLCQFSLRDLWFKGEKVFTAPKDADVEVSCPDDCALPRVGDMVWKVRSQELKERIEKLSHAPGGEQPKASSDIDLRFSILPAETSLRLSVTAVKWGVEFAAKSIDLPLMTAESGRLLSAELKLGFATMGDAGLRAASIEVAGDGPWFVTRGSIKELKRQLVLELKTAYPNFLGSRLDHAQAVISSRGQKLQVKTWSERRYAIKCDRIETLDAVALYLKQEPDFPLSEIVFEPKRAFLPLMAPDELARQLSTRAAALQVPLRIALPTVIRAWDEALLKPWLKAFRHHGVMRYELGNIGALALLEHLDLAADADLRSDFSLYALNAAAAAVWQGLGFATVSLSIEDDRDNLSATLSAWPASAPCPQAILYKDTPLFIAEACSLTALHNGCPTAKVCGYRSLEIENPSGERFIVAHESCKSIVYGKKAYAITQHQRELLSWGVSEFRLDFLTRSYDEAAIIDVLAAANAGNAIAMTHAANYQRGLT